MINELLIYRSVKILLSLLLLFAYQPTLLWLWNKIDYEADSILVVAAIGFGLGAGLLIWVLDKSRNVNKSALQLLLASLICAIVNKITIDFSQLNVAFLIVGAYAVAGLGNYTHPAWSRLLSITLLLALALPFYLEFSSGLGFGIRLLTADLVEQNLHSLGFLAVSSHDIILTENSILHIDIPCSGLKSIWLGHLFFLIFIVLFRVHISWRLALPYLLFFFLLVSVNVTRVMILTLLVAVYKLPDVAEIIHAPLGIIGFGFSCAIAGWLLSQPWIRHRENINSQSANKGTAYGYIPAISGIVMTLCLINIIATPVQLIEVPDRVALSRNMNPVPIRLSAGENRYFSTGKLTTAQKWIIKTKKKNGSLLVVRSRDFNKFHAPELCMAANGIAVEKMKTVEISPGLKVRILSLSGGRRTGIYWLQTGKFTTDSFTERYWRYIWWKNKDWSMVSMILDVPFETGIEEIKKLTTDLHKTLVEA